MQNILESKSLLAKLMATENIHIEQRNVSTAAFNVKDRILVIPILDKNISGIQYDLFMGHEVGHALYTPIEGCVKEYELKLNPGICNVIEDVRIEKKIKFKYPGLRNSFVKAYKELYDKNFFGTEGADLQQMNFIDRVNLHTKVGTHLGIKFSTIERELLREIDSTETYDDVLDVARKVMDYMKQQAEEQKKKVAAEIGDEADDNDYSEFVDLDVEFDFDSNPDNSDNSDDFESSDTSDSESPVKSEGFEEIDNRGTGDVEEEIKSFTDETYKKNQEQLFDKANTHTVYVNVPKLPLEDYVIDYKLFLKMYREQDFAPLDTKGFLKNRQESNKAVQYLAKEFEMRKNADQMKRASISKTGELNMSKIYSYNFNDDIFKKLTVVPDGKSHGLVMLLDWSGSMAGHIENTVKQLISLVMFCKKVNIPYEVYSFVEGNSLNNLSEHSAALKLKRNDLICNGFTLVNLLSSRMSAPEFTYAASALTYISKKPRYSPRWMWMSGTPLNEAIVAMFEIIPQFQKNNKLQIVNLAILSDGDGGRLSNSVDWNPETNTTFPSSFYRRILGTNRIFITDPVTKHQQMVVSDNFGFAEGRAQTAALVKLLKARTNCNVVGFYILKGREFGRESYKFFPTTQSHELLKLEFRRNKFAIAKSAGFDEYYLLRSEAMDTDEDTELEVKENATTRGLVSAFKKYAGARVSNRVVLNRFIGLIT